MGGWLGWEEGWRSESRQESEMRTEPNVKQGLLGQDGCSFYVYIKCNALATKLGKTSVKADEYDLLPTH